MANPKSKDDQNAFLYGVAVGIVIGGSYVGFTARRALRRMMALTDAQTDRAHQSLDYALTKLGPHAPMEELLKVKDYVTTQLMVAEEEGLELRKES